MRAGTAGPDLAGLAGHGERRGKACGFYLVFRGVQWRVLSREVM